ncbi:MAG: glycerophosphodiester phosphodiesterase family protein [Sphingomonadaceae bacterium]
MPSSRCAGVDARLKALAARPFAHRGLHGNGIVENSRAAFAAAIAAGQGIELDVRASRDGEAMVFHDAGLGRLTGREGRVARWNSAALARVRLAASAETIPGLGEILDFIAGRVPLLIELKAGRGAAARLCRAVAAALEAYQGPAGIMSFNPEAGRWFRRHEPSLPRGLVVSEGGGKSLAGRAGRAASLARARPHFLAYDIRDLPSPLALRFRLRRGPVFTWTVRGKGELRTARAHADQIIHELGADGG